MSVRLPAALAVRRWLPEGRPRATLLARTPYDAGAFAAEGRAWAERGVGLVVEDVRGRHASPGAFAPYLDEGPDGLALLRRVRAETEGPLVLHGTSYGAHCALATLALADADDLAGLAGVALAVPALGLGETARTRGDVFCHESRVGWWATHVGADLPGWERVLGARRDDDARADRVARLDLPLHLVGGTRDWFAHDTVDLAGAWGGPVDLALGPWDHGLRGSRRAERLLRWLDEVTTGRAPERTELVDDGGRTHHGWAAGRAHRLPGGVVRPGASAYPSPPLATRLLPAGERPDRLVVDVPPLGAVRGLATVTVDADVAGQWCVTLAVRTEAGLEELVSGAARGPRVELGPVLLDEATAGRLALVVAAEAFPRYARDPEPAPRHVRGIDLEVT